MFTKHVTTAHYIKYSAMSWLTNCVDHLVLEIRLRALIAQRRDTKPGHVVSTLPCDTVSLTLTSLACVVNGSSAKKTLFDPLFDDPFVP